MISVGIDIGKYSLKVARVEGSAKGFQVVSLDDYPLPSDPLKDGTLDILEALRDIRERHGDDDVQFIIGADQSHISSRRRSFPFVERHKILKSLPFELEDDIPLNLENAIFEAKITHFTGNTANVLAMACPKDHVEDRLQQLVDANLEPQLMSSEGIAIASLFEDWLEAPYNLDVGSENQESTLILNLGHEKTTGVVIHQGFTLDTFTLDWGGQEVATTLAAKYSIHYVEALKELRKKAFILLNNEGVTREQVALSDILKGEADRLANQLRLVIAKLETENSIKVTQGVLCGGLAQLRNLGPYLTQKIEVPFNRLAHIENLPNLDFATNPNNELSHIISIGLAAEGLKRPKNPAVNFLKNEYARQNESLQVFWRQWGPAVRATAGLFAIFLVWSFFRTGVAEGMLDTAEDRLRDVAKNVANMQKPSKKKIRNYIRDQKKKKKQMEVFGSLQGINSALDVLKKVSALAPAKKAGDINITQFSVKNDEILISGYANRTELIQQFQKSLKDYALGGRLDLAKSTGAVPSGQKGFSFNFKARRDEGDI